MGGLATDTNQRLGAVGAQIHLSLGASRTTTPRLELLQSYLEPFGALIGVSSIAPVSFAFVFALFFVGVLFLAPRLAGGFEFVEQLARFLRRDAAEQQVEQALDRHALVVVHLLEVHKRAH